MRSLENVRLGEVIQDEHDREFQILTKERCKNNGDLHNWRGDEFKVVVLKLGQSCSNEALGEKVGPLSGDVFKSRLRKHSLGIT